MKARPNAAVQRMMVRNAVSRCATSKISAKKNIMDNRKATDEVLRYCTIIAAFDVLEFDGGHEKPRRRVHSRARCAGADPRAAVT